MRLAWFSPLPPVRSGVSAYSAELLPRLARTCTIDTYLEGARPGTGAFDAHEFVWRRRLTPYDLVVYQLGNAPCHDYMWAYLAACPGLAVLHDARLHHARARSLLQRRRFDDYRAEFRFDHPDAPPEVTEYAVEGLGGPIYYLWPMLRVVMNTARLVAVHNARVADDLREAYPSAIVETIRMGVSDLPARPDEAARLRREWRVPDGGVIFTAFGKITAEKRIGAIMRAFERLVSEGIDAYLLLAGDADGYAFPGGDRAATDRIRVIGHIDDRQIGACLAASDACLCLRWPTAQETSASWLRCLAAGRPTIVSALAHLADIPVVDPRRGVAGRQRREPVAIAIDLLDEDASLLQAMRRLATDAALRADLGRAGRAYWQRGHTLDAMASDYQRVIEAAAARPAPSPGGLPAHLTSDHSEYARRVLSRFGADLDILR